jgi:hypothetical protein
LGWLATLLTLRSATAFALLAAVLTLFVGVLSAVVVVTVAVAVTSLTAMVKVKVSVIVCPGVSVSVFVLPVPLVVITPPAVPTTTLPVTFAAVLVPLLL